MALPTIIRGSATHRLRDLLAYHEYVVPRAFFGKFVVFYIRIVGLTIIGLAVFLLGFNISCWIAALSNPGPTELRWFFAGLWRLTAAIFIGFTFLVVFSTFRDAARFRHRAAGRHLLSYVIDDIGIHISDALGFSRRIPWSVVAGHLAYRDILLLNLNGKAWNYILLQAFTPDERLLVQAMAQEAAKGWRPQSL